MFAEIWVVVFQISPHSAAALELEVCVCVCVCVFHVCFMWLRGECIQRVELKFQISSHSLTSSLTFRNASTLPKTKADGEEKQSGVKEKERGEGEGEKERVEGEREKERGEGEREREREETVYTAGMRHTHTLLYRPSDWKWNERLSDEQALCVYYNGAQIDEEVGFVSVCVYERVCACTQIDEEVGFVSVCVYERVCACTQIDEEIGCVCIIEREGSERGARGRESLLKIVSFLRFIQIFYHSLSFHFHSPSLSPFYVLSLSLPLSPSLPPHPSVRRPSQPSLSPMPLSLSPSLLLTPCHCR